MRRWTFVLALLIGLLALVACAAEEKATPAPTAPGAQSKPAWEQEWERVLAAAKQEGKVVVLGPPGAQYREAFVDNFEKKYGIRVEFLGGSGSELAARVKAERAAGQYLWDVQIHGTTTAVGDLTASGIADQIKPALILPEVTDTKNWRDGRLDFADKAESHNLVFFGSPKVMVVYNKSMVDPNEIKTYRDLLNPKWKGKITSQDPRMAGAGLATFTFYYLYYGEEYVKELLNQNLMLSRDVRQVVEWVAQGRAAMAIGPNEDFTKAFIDQGAPLGVIEVLENRGYLTSAWGSVTLLNRSPHPNAAKIYINYILSKEGQTALSKASGYLSRRTDVPIEAIAEWSKIRPNVNYDTTNYKEDVVMRKDEIATIIGKYLQ